MSMPTILYIRLTSCELLLAHFHCLLSSLRSGSYWGTISSSLIRASSAFPEIFQPSTKAFVRSCNFSLLTFPSLSTIPSHSNLVPCQCLTLVPLGTCGNSYSNMFSLRTKFPDCPTMASNALSTVPSCTTNLTPSFGSIPSISSLPSLFLYSLRVPFTLAPQQLHPSSPPVGQNK